MKKHTSQILYIIGVALSLGVFGLLLAFTHAFLFVAPYAGFYFNPMDGSIHRLYGKAASHHLLHEGDLLRKVGEVTFEKFLADRTIQFFKNVQPGETVEIVVVRNGEEIKIPWVLPGRTPEEFRGRFVNIWWLAYIFWGFGLAVQLFMRPRNTRWRLLIALNEATGFWLLLGNISWLHIWYSSVLLRAVTWLALPVYLNLHWLFPRPLGRIPAWVWMILYLLCGGLALGEILQLLPSGLYFVGVLLMFGGSIVLLFLHYRHPYERHAVQLLLFSMAIALMPAILVSLSGLAGRIPEAALLGLLALPFMPAAYVFLIFRQQLGGLEVRASRAISVYAYLILLATILLLLTGFVPVVAISSVSPFLTVIVIGLTAAGISVVAFPPFQSFLDRYVLGIKLPYQNLPETYSSRISTSTSVKGLLQLLEKDVFPSLLVRQFAFLQLSDHALHAILVQGMDADQLPDRDGVNELVSLAGRFRPPEEGQPHPWLRLVLSLKAGDSLLGLWLFGRRDPDDLYHAIEIPIFQSLADQTAIAMSNLLQAERLRSLYQLDIERREQEKKRLAMELHDSVLNQLAVLRMNVGEKDPPPRFQEAYEKVVERLREVVSELRPPLLNYGLKLALEELAQSLMERSGNAARVSLAMWENGERYSPDIELHLFRIVQEACENALRHAKAANVLISAQLDAKEIRLEIEDDGIGFEMDERMELDGLLRHKHFGLAGIVERANLIGAQTRIQSAPEKGTKIQVNWRAPAEGQE